MSAVGRVLKKGHLRVDARKAITKLRDHLLVDLHLYAVEVARAAVLAGASRVDVTYDADDVIIAFDGRALAAEELPRLFEHLTAGGDDDEARSARLLALAVNAALGLAPAWISVTTSHGEAAARVTWTPALVLAIEREDRALPAPEVIARPADMPATGTRFQLRRKVGWEVVRRAAARTLPRELVLLAEAATCLRVPLTLQGAPAAPPDRPRAIAGAAFPLRGARAARLEITPTTEVAPHADFCELGLLLARTSFAFGRHFPMAEHLGVSPPVRIVIDADALPTNASRSAVRDDTPLLRELAGAAAGALADAIAGITATLFERGAVPEGVTVDASDRAALEDALGAFVCAAEASLKARVALPEALRAVLELPLFRDGLGRPMTHADIPREDPLRVWTGKEPVPPEMEPWAGSILWLGGRRGGRVAERILAGRISTDPEKLAGMAKQGAVRYRKLLATPPTEVAVPDDTYLCRERFAFTEGPLAGLTGEVAVGASAAPYVRNLGLRVFLEGRCFDTFPIPEDAIPLPCLIALQWPGQIAPRFAYDGVEEGAGLRGAIAYAVRAAVLLCERLAAERGRDGPPFDNVQAALLQSAIATAALAPARTRPLPGFEMPALTELPGLVCARVWPALAGRLVSLQTLCEYASKTGAVCVASPGVRGPAPDDRPVVRLPAAQLEHLRTCLHPQIKIIRYDAALLAGAEPRVASGALSPEAVASPRAGSRARERMDALVANAAAAAKAPVLRLERPGHTCLVTLGRAEVRAWHAGIALSTTPLDPGLGNVTIAVDDDSIVPQEKWDGVLFSQDPGLAAQAERAYAERIVAAVLGDEQARAELLPPASEPGTAPYAWPEERRELPPAVLRYLIDRAGRGRAEGASEEARELGARIEVIPFLTMIGEDGEAAAASLTGVEAAHPAPNKIPCLPGPLPFKPVRWRPVLSREQEVSAALGRWAGGRLRDARDELAERERSAGLETEYIKFLRRPSVDAAVVGPRGDPGSPTVFLPPSSEYGLPGIAAALPERGVDLPHAVIEVLFEGRIAGEEALTEVPIPLVARVSVLDRAALDGFRGLSAKGRRSAGERVRQVAVTVVQLLLERASKAGAEHTLFSDLRALHLVLAVLRHAQGEELRGALCNGELRWPTVQGGNRPFGALRVADGELWAGTVAHASWIAGKPPTDLDRPILHVPPSPEGSAMVGILEHFRIKIRPVSDAIASLQANRAKGTTSRPSLAERPLNPALARDLDKLGIRTLAGELAIYESGDPVAEIHTLDGETMRIRMDLPFPARAVARTELLTRAAATSAADKIARAATAFLAGFGRSLEAQPPFVRAHLRALVCREVAKERELPPGARAAPLFQDIDGAACSLDDLQAEGSDWSCTFDPPPYPRHRQEGRTIVLTAAEHVQLHTRIPILNVTEWMRRDLEAERRREGPQVARVRIDEALRGHLLSSFVVDAEGLSGEIGLLRPSSAEARGLQVLVTRRPLCKMDDAPGWPIAAVLNDDTLHPDRWFTALAPADETHLRARARRLAGDHLGETLRAGLPADRRGDVFLDALIPGVEAYGSTAPMSLTGVLYLPATWPVEPSARVVVQGVDKPFDGPIALASAPIHSVLPIGGVFFVAHREAVFHRGAAGRVALALRAALEKLLAPLVRQAPDDAELAAYLWNVRLLGGVAAGEPSAIGAGGETVTAGDVTRALESGEIWLTDRRGSSDGAFPGGAPPFVLRDEPSPLLRVLRARAAGKLRVLGGQEVDTPASPLAPPSLAPPPPAPLPEVLDFTAPAPPESRRRPARSWLGAVLERVSEALAPKAGEEPPPGEISAAVERALRALRLRDEPVIVVKEARRGKLLRYEKGNRVITINIAHPALAPIVGAPSPAAVRRACLALTAAAVTEVNIALEHVTDHDESEALLELLRQDAAAAR